MTTQDLKQLLEAHVADVAERDFADRAWSDALARQHSRRLVIGGGLAAAVSAAVAAVVVPGLRGAGDTRVATPTPSPSTPVATSRGRIAFSGRDGTPYVLGGDQASLRAAEVATKLPPQDLRTPSAMRSLQEVLAAGSADESFLYVVAVASRRVAGTDRPLFFLNDPGAGFTWAAVDLRLDMVDPVNGGTGVQPGAIGPDGHTVVFVQPRGLVVVDARANAVRRVPVGGGALADVRLESGGFADDGAYVTWGSGRAFVLPKAGTSLVRVEADARPEAWSIESPASVTDGRPVLVHRGPDHSPVGSLGIGTPFEGYGPTASGAGWVVRGGFPHGDSMPTGEARVSGLLAVKEDGARRKVLVMDEDKDGDIKGGLTAVAFLDWTERPTVVFRYRSPRADSLGAWDLGTDAISFVSRLDDPTDSESRPRVVAVSTRTSWVS